MTTARAPKALLTRALDRFAWLLGTGAGTGLSPVAPGTVGSLVAVAVYALLPIQSPSLTAALVVLGLFVLGSSVVGRLETASKPDPGKVVWDEYVGMWLTCSLIPERWPYLVAGFFLFRLFDVIKPFPARRLEHLHGGLGIMADDLMAGGYAGLVIVLFTLIPGI